MAHYGGTLGLLEREPEEIARALETWAHSDHLIQQARKRRS